MIIIKIIKKLTIFEKLQFKVARKINKKELR